MPGCLQQRLWFERSCNHHLKQPFAHDSSYSSSAIVEHTVHLFYAMVLHRHRLPAPVAALVLKYLFRGEPCERGTRHFLHVDWSTDAPRVQRQPVWYSSWLQTPYLFMVSARETMKHDATINACAISVNVSLPTALPFAALLRHIDAVLTEQVARYDPTCQYLPCVHATAATFGIHVALRANASATTSTTTVSIGGRRLLAPRTLSPTSTYLFDALHASDWASLTLRPLSLQRRAFPASKSGGIALLWELQHVDLT